MGNLKSKLGRSNTAGSEIANNVEVNQGVPSSGSSKQSPRTSSSDSNVNMVTKTVRLQHQGNCSGMFWRGDPLTNASPPDNRNWPRNGALLKGTGPHVINNTEYFKVTAIRQAGKKSFQPVPDGTWMLYEQQGRLLFDAEDTTNS